jgi:hypothetical protein
MPKNLKRLTGYGDLHFITFCCYQRPVAQTESSKMNLGAPSRRVRVWGF